MNQDNTFTQYKDKFDNTYMDLKEEYRCFLSKHTNEKPTTFFKKKDETNNEEYYKWQFLYAITESNLIDKKYIGTEIYLPKGNKTSAPIKIDAVIFDESSWFKHYQQYHQTNDLESLEWLRDHIIAVIEFKKEDCKNTTEVWEKQLKSYMRESNRDFCLGVLYDNERLYLFRKANNKFLRFSDEFNSKGDESKSKDLCLHLTDPYINIPSFQQLISWDKSSTKTRGGRSIKDLDVISGIQSVQINDAMSEILRTMDKVGLKNQKGFEILIQILSLKIFDEKCNENYPQRHLLFYIDKNEKNNSLSDDNMQKFISRIQDLRNEACYSYHRILKEKSLNFKNQKHIKLLIEVVSRFQDYSFVRSHKTDLYQLVFYKFATPFSKEQNAQFITPLPLIDFLVKIVNPRSMESVIDPTAGIADFLSVSYVNSNSKLDDNNIFGMDIDEQMVMLSTLNMLLNGDGNAKIEEVTGYGSLSAKFSTNGEIICLTPETNMNGNWDVRCDDKELKKFDIVLTNPPFGEDRSFTIKNNEDAKIAMCYELWNLYNPKSPQTIGSRIDLGVLFLENAYRILKEGGRMGIVLSNSIASIESHSIARKWLMDKMRIVGIFDLPQNVFAETGVNTSIIVAYKPKKEDLEKLKQENYQIFAKNIKKVGYEIKTSKRVKYFAPIYKIDYDTFETKIDKNGRAILDEDFTETVSEFKDWCSLQEQTLQDLFIKEK